MRRNSWPKTFIQNRHRGPIHFRNSEIALNFDKFCAPPLLVVAMFPNSSTKLLFRYLAGVFYSDLPDRAVKQRFA